MAPSYFAALAPRRLLLMWPVVASLASQLKQAADDHDEDWSYTDIKAWSTNHEWMCGHENGQSPIDIRTGELDAVCSQDLSLEYHEATLSGALRMKTTRHSWEVAFPAGGAPHVVFANKTFTLDKLQFHSPSENTIDGQHSDMEVQMVHMTEDGKILVVAALLAAAHDKLSQNAFLDKFWGLFITGVHGEVVKDVAGIANPYTELLRERHEYMVWNGSLTAPPCTSDVTWVLMRQPTEISGAQLRQYREGISSLSHNTLQVRPHPPHGVSKGAWDTSLGLNNRPVQPLAARKICLVAGLGAEEQLARKAWAMSPSWKCSSGGDSYQSPIDVNSSVADDASCVSSQLEYFAGEHTSGSMHLIVDRDTWKVGYPREGVPQVAIAGKAFALRQIHTHSPSEHTVDGRHTDMEVQLLHEAADGQIMVIASLLRVRNQTHASNVSHAADEFLDVFWSRFPTSGKEGELIANFQHVNDPYRALLTDRDSYWTWEGSLTAPPFTNDVKWVLAKQPTAISAQHLRKYREGINTVLESRLTTKNAQPPPGVRFESWDQSLGTNNRPTQPLAGRRICSERR